MSQLFGKYRYRLLTWGTVIFFAVLYVSLIFNDNLLTDEAFTMQLISGSLPEIISGTAHDVHPPLYYIFAKAVYALFGRGIPPQKVLALIPMVLSLMLGPIVVAKDYGERAGFWYTLFLACAPCTMEFALQVRMYSMAVLFITGAFLWSGRILRKERAAVKPAPGEAPGSFGGNGTASPVLQDWIIYILWMLAAAYTHYFALVAAGFLQLALGWRLCFGESAAGSRVPSASGSIIQNLKPWLLASLAMIIGYLPWAWILLRQTLLVTESYWIPPITPEVVYGYFLWAFGLENNPMTAPVFMMLLAVLWFAPKRAAGTDAGSDTTAVYEDAEAVHCAHKDAGADDAAVCAPALSSESAGETDALFMSATARAALLIPILVLLFGVGFSLLTRPIFRDQYLFPCMGLIALYFGIGMQGLAGFGEVRDPGADDRIGQPNPAAPISESSGADPASQPGPDEPAAPPDSCAPYGPGAGSAGFRDPVALAVAVIIGAFLLYVGAIQYKECFHQEYRSTLVPELEAYFAGNLNPGDCIVYNFEVFGFIYEYYFPENDLIYIEDYDPENDYEITYFLDTPYNREFTYEELVEWGYTMAYCGRMGVEQNEFEVYKLWKNNE